MFVRNQDHVFGVVFSKLDFAHGSSLFLQNVPNVGITFFSRMPTSPFASEVRWATLMTTQLFHPSIGDGFAGAVAQIDRSQKFRCKHTSSAGSRGLAATHPSRIGRAILLCFLQHQFDANLAGSESAEIAPYGGKGRSYRAIIAREAGCHVGRLGR
jgi:hypothetical protein